MSIELTILLDDGEQYRVVFASLVYAQGYVDALAAHDLVSKEEHQRLCDEIEREDEARVAVIANGTDGMDGTNEEAYE